MTREVIRISLIFILVVNLLVSFTLASSDEFSGGIGINIVVGDGSDEGDSGDNDNLDNQVSNSDDGDGENNNIQTNFEQDFEDLDEEINNQEINPRINNIVMLNSKQEVKESKKRGRPKLHSEDKIKAAETLFNELQAEGKSVNECWLEVSIKLDFKTPEAAKQAVHRLMKQNKKQN